MLTEAQKKFKQELKKVQEANLAELFFQQITNQSLPLPEKEFQFHPTRKWRFDYCYTKQKIAFEIEGGVYSGGRHTRGKGYEDDCVKYNWATLMGYRVFRVTSRLIVDGHLSMLLCELSNELRR